MLQWIFEKVLDYSTNHDKIKFYTHLSRFDRFMTVWEKKYRLK